MKCDKFLKGLYDTVLCDSTRLSPGTQQPLSGPMSEHYLQAATVRNPRTPTAGERLNRPVGRVMLTGGTQRPQEGPLKSAAPDRALFVAPETTAIWGIQIMGWQKQLDVSRIYSLKAPG